MRPSLLTVVALLAAAAACLEHAGAELAAPRRSRSSLTSVFLPTVPSSDDLDWCWESLLTLGFCKDDFVASFLAGRPAPRECCLAADEAVHHCGPLTRAFLGLILPRGLLEQCAHQAVTAAPTRLPGQRRRAPPRAPTLGTGPRASGGARQPPAPEAGTGARSPPPRAPASGASSGTHGSPPEVSVREESPPEPKVIVAGGRASRATGAPPAASATPPLQKGVPAARPGVKGPPIE
ncbi:unnamed protein product [Urochloa humidicola]